MICGDLKIVIILLGQQSGFTKNPCFLCLWDSRDRKNQYKKKKCRNGNVTLHINIIKDAGLRSMRVKYKEDSQRNVATILTL